ncbi:MAG: hypothetical protein P8N76_05530 [Pirellulaceae bacterium]|nr:hypothetical protein [Planctomycetaceae bacterium]MDG2381114.1 hypothetical protein [Pirellulaceae bacterium]
MCRSASKLTTVFGVLILLSSAAPADMIADSVEDWSLDGIQGENNWTYGYYNLTLDEEDDGEYAAEDFIPFLNDDSFEVGPEGENHWDGNQWRLYRDGEGVGTGLAQTGPWTRIGADDFGHPNGTNSAVPTEVDDPMAEEHWSIRRWESNHFGPASVEIALTAQNANCGNGTALHLFQNGQLLTTLFEPNFGVAEEETISLNLSNGDLLDIALSPEGEDEGRGDACDGSLFHMTVYSEGEGLLGDYDSSGVIDAPDLDVHAQYVADGNLLGDLNEDGTTDINDRLLWISDIQKSWLGDSNFDGEFNSSDFVVVFGAAKYEKEVTATYAEGDWNGDTSFNSSDFVAAFSNGGYEQGPRQAANAVPEPSSLCLVLLGIIGLSHYLRKN